MKWLESRMLWGILLILGGILFLLDNLGIITFGGLIWGVIFALAGLVFLSVFITNREHWWALIPGFVLLGIGAIILLDTYTPGGAGELAGVIFLGGIGLAFLLVYLVNRENWWAIIPAGVMATLAVVAGLSQVLTGFETGGIFFLGLGLTFALVAILPTPEGQMRWAFIPAGILLLMGLLITAAMTSLLGILWPFALILIGLFFIWRAFVARA